VRKLAWFIAVILAVCSAPAFAQQLPGAIPFSCFVENVSAATQCQVPTASPFRIYVTGFVLSDEVATAQSLTLLAGTGAACGTNTIKLTHAIALPTAVGSVVNGGGILLVVPTGNAVCVSPSAATAFGATLTGYIAP
jgi:hypothetical protein